MILWTYGGFYFLLSGCSTSVVDLYKYKFMLLGNEEMQSKKSS
jgi:hypothetical protein